MFYRTQQTCSNVLWINKKSIRWHDFRSKSLFLHILLLGHFLGFSYDAWSFNNRSFCVKCSGNSQCWFVKTISYYGFGFDLKTKKLCFNYLSIGNRCTYIEHYTQKTKPNCTALPEASQRKITRLSVFHIMYHCTLHYTENLYNK